MYAYDELDRTLINERVVRIPRSGEAPALRRTHRGRIQDAAAAERRLSATARLHVPRRHPLRHAVVEAVAARWRMSRAATTAATAISPPGRTSSTTGSSSPNCRMRWPILPKSASTPCRPPATTCATSPRTSGPASRRARSRIPASGRKSCGSTPRCIRNSRSCRASSRSRSPRPSTTAPRSRSTTSACACTGTRDGETGFEVLVGGGLGRTPFIAKTIKPFVHGRDILSYVEAILRVYNQYGRRDNIYKARIKILVHELGIEKFAARSRGGMEADGRQRADARSFRRSRKCARASPIRPMRSCRTCRTS